MIISLKINILQMKKLTGENEVMYLWSLIRWWLRFEPQISTVSELSVYTHCLCFYVFLFLLFVRKLHACSNLSLKFSFCSKCHARFFHVVLLNTTKILHCHPHFIYEGTGSQRWSSVPQVTRSASDQTRIILWDCLLQIPFLKLDYRIWYQQPQKLCLRHLANVSTCK